MLENMVLVNCYFKFGHIAIRFSPSATEEYSLTIKARESSHIIKAVHMKGDDFEAEIEFHKPLKIMFPGTNVYGLHTLFSATISAEEGRALWDELVELGFGLSGRTKKVLKNKISI